MTFGQKSRQGDVTFVYNYNNITLSGFSEKFLWMLLILIIYTIFEYTSPKVS